MSRPLTQMPRPVNRLRAAPIPKCAAMLIASETQIAGPCDMTRNGRIGMKAPTADEEKNPFAGDPKAVAAGKVLYGKTCQKCHGPGGKGDGPDADPDAMQDMDLTNPRRAARNPDGIVFYKIWNGRKKPKMPAQKDKLTKDEVWQIVSYAQTLRQKS